jgi:pantothenate kinase-related protein Tda10
MLNKLYLAPLLIFLLVVAISPSQANEPSWSAIIPQKLKKPRVLISLSAIIASLNIFFPTHYGLRDNWGAGNVKRMLARMGRKGITENFSNFYHYLYETQQLYQGDKSLKAALEYLPSLWNIAKVIR